MKPSGFLAGLAVGLLGLAAFAVTSRCGSSPAMPLERLHEAGWLQHELKLDAAQVKQIELQVATDVTNAAVTAQSNVESVQAAQAARHLARERHGHEDPEQRVTTPPGQQERHEPENAGRGVHDPAQTFAEGRVSGG